MNCNEIKTRLSVLDLNFTVIAKAINVSPVTVSQVANRQTTSKKVAQAIAKAINAPFLDVFPEYASKSPKIRLNKKTHSHRVRELKKVLG